jgi:translation initiation factor RLI1
MALVQYKKCKPDECDPDKGLCAAVKACTHKIMKQIDGPFQPPMVLYQDMCQGCGDCAIACPLDAIKIQ